MKEELFSENEMNQSEFLEIKIEGTILSESSLYVNIILITKYAYGYV
jgi:hypothetical protein